jgi:hypothetical protein
MPTQLLPLQVIQALEALSGTTLTAILIVLSVVLFVGPYWLARKYDLGTAHAVGAGIAGLGFVFLFRIVVELI